MLFLVCLLISGGIDYAIVPWLTDGLSFTEFSNPSNYNIEDYIQAHRIVQLISQIFIFIIPALLFAYLAFPRPLQYLKTNTKLQPKYILWGIFIMICSLPLINLLEYFNKMIPITDGMRELEETAALVTTAFLKTSNPIDIILNVVIFVLAAAIGEELFFRGVLQNILISNPLKKYPFTAIAIIAVLFSLFHGEMSGFIPRFYAGFLLGAAYYFSNTIWVPIIMHAVNNGMALLMFYVSKTEFEDPIGVLDYKDLLEIIPLTILSLFLIYHFYKKRTTYTIDQMAIDDDETHFLANKNYNEQ